MTVIKVLTIILFSSILLNASSASNGVLIASSSVEANSLSAKEVRSIFMGKTTLWKNNARINIGVNIENKEVSNYFFRNYLKTSERRYKKYWLKRVFSGSGIAPKIFKNFKEAIEYVSDNENSILFLSNEDDQIPSNIKIIKIYK